MLLVIKKSRNFTNTGKSNIFINHCFIGIHIFTVLVEAQKHKPQVWPCSGKQTTKREKKRKTFMAENIHGGLGGDTDVEEWGTDRKILVRNKKRSFQHLDMRRSPVRRNVDQHFTFVFSSCRLGFRPPDLTGFGLLPRWRQARGDLPELDLHSLPSPAFCCHTNGYIIVKNQSNLFVLASQSFPFPSAAFNCMMCFPADRVQSRASASYTNDGEFNKEIPHKSGFIQHYPNRCVEPSQIILKTRIKRVSENPDVQKQTSQLIYLFSFL